MDPAQGIEILQQLSDGVNPYTGERFPADSSYQQADTVRALHLALEGLTKLRRSTARKTGPGRAWTEYAYDHQGRMVWKRISTNAVVVSTRTLLWDGYNIIRELITDNGSLITTNAYVWGLDLSGSLQGAGGVGGLLVEIKDGTPYFAAFDANGNVTEYLSADGSLAAHYEYSPFGEIVVQSGPLGDSFTHRFSTKPWCAVTGLCEYELRKYSPRIGRWLNRDPIGEWGGDNLYAFVGNAPISSADPLGLMATPPKCKCCCVENRELKDYGHKWDRNAKTMNVFKGLASHNFDAVLTMTESTGPTKGPCHVKWTDGPAEYPVDSWVGLVGHGQTKVYEYDANPPTWTMNDQPGVYVYYTGSRQPWSQTRWRTVTRILHQTWEGTSTPGCKCSKRSVRMKLEIKQVVENGQPKWDKWYIKKH